MDFSNSLNPGHLIWNSSCLPSIDFESLNCPENLYCLNYAWSVLSLPRRASLWLPQHILPWAVLTQCLAFLSCCSDKIPWTKQVREKRFIYFIFRSILHVCMLCLYVCMYVYHVRHVFAQWPRCSEKEVVLYRSLVAISATSCWAMSPAPKGFISAGKSVQEQCQQPAPSTVKSRENEYMHALAISFPFFSFSPGCSPCHDATHSQLT